MQFADFGQPRVEALLGEMLERGRAIGSFLFEGPLGTGKEAVAVELGRILNCENGGTCPPKPIFARGDTKQAARTAGRTAAVQARCSSCRKFDLLQHPDLLLVFPVPLGTWDEPVPESRGSEPKLNTIGRILHEKAQNPYYRFEDFERPASIHADVLREQVLQAAGTRPAEGRVKVIVLSDADRITPNMANVLLKTLEEPPPDRLFVLTTSVPQALLPTIVSRCQRVRFAPLAPAWMEPRLQTLFGETPPKAKLAAAVSQGSMLAAARFLEGDLEEVRDHAFAVLRAASTGDTLELLEIPPGLAQEHTKKRHKVPLVLQMIAVAARDAALVAAGAGTSKTGPALVNADRRNEIEALARVFSVEALHAIVQRVELAERQIAGYAFCEHALATAFIDLAALAATPAGRDGLR